MIPQVKKGNIFYAIAGTGKLDNEYQMLINRLGLDTQVFLLGFRKDVVELYNAADIYILPSIREGLNVSLMEAMASGLPIACSKIRGNVDLINENGGVLFDSSSVELVETAIKKLIMDSKARMQMRKYNLEKIKEFDITRVTNLISKIYQEI